jgi:hypothetical protein
MKNLNACFSLRVVLEKTSYYALLGRRAPLHVYVCYALDIVFDVFLHHLLSPLNNVSL